jgi:hypothetical protein
LLATIIETKPWFNKHRIEFRGKERERENVLCEFGSSVLFDSCNFFFYVYLHQLQQHQFQKRERERERESVCVYVWFFPPPAPFCLQWLRTSTSGGSHYLLLMLSISSSLLRKGEFSVTSKSYQLCLWMLNQFAGKK